MTAVVPGSLYGVSPGGFGAGEGCGEAALRLTAGHIFRLVRVCVLLAQTDGSYTKNPAMQPAATQSTMTVLPLWLRSLGKHFALSRQI